MRQEEIDDVRSWLERGGHVLEMQVAQTVTPWAVSVDQGYHYTDRTTEKEREGDVSAVLLLDRLEGHAHTIELLIECKSTTAPWVFFRGSPSGNGPWTPVSYSDPDCAVCYSIEYGLQVLRHQVPQAYAVTEKRAENKSAQDHAYAAVHQATSAVVGQYGGSDGRDGHPFVNIVTTFAVPLVVTKSPLVMCSLDEFGDVNLEEVTRVAIEVPRRGLPDPDTVVVGVDVIHVSELETYLADLRSLDLTRDIPGGDL